MHHGTPPPPATPQGLKTPIYQVSLSCGQKNQPWGILGAVLEGTRQLVELFGAVMAAVDASGLPMHVAAQALEVAMQEVDDRLVEEKYGPWADALSWAPDVPTDSRAFAKAMAGG